MKNPLETPTQVRKRKASDDNSDDDVVVCENTEVKENNLKQVEKKTKVENHVSGKETVDLTIIIDDDSQEGGEAIEVEEEKCSETVRKVTTKAANVEKQSKTVNPQTPCSNTNVTSKKGKQGSKLKVKLGFIKCGKTDAKTDNSKTETVNLVSMGVFIFSKVSLK